MNVKSVIVIGFALLALSATVMAQSAPPKVGTKPLVRVRPTAPMGCKLVGTVRGTKLWAGDCTDAAEIRGTSPAASAPSTLPEQAAGAIPPGQKQ